MMSVFNATAFILKISNDVEVNPTCTLMSILTVEGNFFVAHSDKRQPPSPLLHHHNR